MTGVAVMLAGGEGRRMGGGKPLRAWDTPGADPFLNLNGWKTWWPASRPPWAPTRP